MMIPGIIMKKCKLSTDGFGKGLSNLVLYIAQPALIFRSYLRAFDKGILINMLYVFLFSIITHLIFTVAAMICFKKAPDAMRRMLRFSTIFSNAAFMGMPLIASVIGDEALIYASIYNITFNAWLWTLGVYICTANKDIDGDGIDDGAEIRKNDGINFVKVATHPTMIAAALGLVCFFLSFDASAEGLPVYATFFIKIFDDIAGLVAPLSMIVLGLRLAEIDLRGFFKDKNLYVCLALRHILLPTAVYFVMRLFTLMFSIHIDVITSILIMASAPVATSATMFAEKYDCDSAYVSKVVAVSTILSIATMPIISLLTMI
jgi:predicted permease